MPTLWPRCYTWGQASCGEPLCVQQLGNHNFEVDGVGGRRVLQHFLCGTEGMLFAGRQPLHLRVVRAGGAFNSRRRKGCGGQGKRARTSPYIMEPDKKRDAEEEVAVVDGPGAGVVHNMDDGLCQGRILRLLHAESCAQKERQLLLVDLP